MRDIFRVVQRVCLKAIVPFVFEKKYSCFSRHSNHSEKFLTIGTANPQRTRNDKKRRNETYPLWNGKYADGFF